MKKIKKQNNELKNAIEENKKAKLKKSYDNLSTPTKIPQSVRKRDDKVRTFAPKELETYESIEEISYLPKYYEESDTLKELINEYNYTKEEKYIFDPIMGYEKLNPKYTEQLMEDSIFQNNELKISNERIKYLDKIIEKSPNKIDIINQLKTLYTIRKNYFEVRYNNPESERAHLRFVDGEIRKLEYEFKN